MWNFSCPRNWKMAKVWKRSKSRSRTNHWNQRPSARLQDGVKLNRKIWWTIFWPQTCWLSTPPSARQCGKKCVRISPTMSCVLGVSRPKVVLARYVYINILKKVHNLWVYILLNSIKMRPLIDLQCIVIAGWFGWTAGVQWDSSGDCLFQPVTKLWLPKRSQYLHWNI